MSGYDWNGLSEWHNAWLAADAAERQHLRRRLGHEQPALIAEADALIASSDVLPDFLETPALMVAAQEMARATETLSTSDRVGPYQIVSVLAHGGMGDVYRATDIRLHRDVALKMLAHAGVPDSDETNRFVQEARITAALDHPNIVRVFDVGMFHGRPYIVVELLEGETLRGRLAAGSTGVAEARRIAADVARGLVVAHMAGLVHRDLKPENIFLTKAGTTKILDFGIAKLARPRLSRESSTTSDVLLGTTGYLAPEQIQGAVVDGRADLFALGAILFEMLTGESAFRRAATVDALHAVVDGPAPSVLAHCDDVPVTLAAVTDRLLEKDPDARFQSAVDLAWALEHIDTPSVGRPRPAPESLARPSSRQWMQWVAGAIAIAAVAVAALGVVLREAAPADQARPLRQFTWSLPGGMSLDSAAVIGPDQQRLAFVGREGSTTRLFVRDLASLGVTAIPGTEGAKQPFWSPDGRFIGFFARGRLMKVAVQGGPPVALAAADDARGGTWGRNDVIVFQPEFRDSPLFRVSASGGPVSPVTRLDQGADEINHRYPAFLPDGVHFLYQTASMTDERRGVYLASVDASPAGTPALLFRSDVPTTYVAGPNHTTGFLLSAVNERIEARPFDPTTLRLTGEPRTITFAAAGATLRHEPMLSASPDVLAFAGVPVPSGVYTASVSRDGRDLQLWPDAEMSGWLRLSPDGTRLMRTVVDPRGNPDIWVEDLARGPRLRVTSSVDLDVSAVWSPDGRQVAFRSGRSQAPHVSVGSADGTGIRKTLPCPRPICEPTDWSSDGRTLIVNAAGDIWTIPLSGSDAPEALVAGSFIERDARFSPDGRWIVYVSEESGRPEVSLRSMTGQPKRQIVSSGGGDQPVWSRDGRELFYVDSVGQLYSVTVRASTEENLTLSAPTKLAVPRLGLRHWGTSYDVSPDRQRVYFEHPGTQPIPRELGIVLNWMSLFR